MAVKGRKGSSNLHTWQIFPLSSGGVCHWGCCHAVQVTGCVVLESRVGNAPLGQFYCLVLCSGVEKNSCSTCLLQICGKGVSASVLGSRLRGLSGPMVLTAH